MANKIIPLIPQHTVYCEPFAGGASILFMKPFPKVTSAHHYREVINDTNGLVFNFYKQLRDNPIELQRLINCTAYCERTYAEAKLICQNKKEADGLQKAWAFFVNINMSFASKLNAGWGRGVFEGNHSCLWCSKIENLNKYLNRMQGIYISNTDALTCIQQWDSPQTFFYIDPPYVNTGQGHYSGYTQEDLGKLTELLKSIDGSFILSGYKNTLHPDEWERFEFEAYCSASSKGSVGKGRDKSTKAIDTGNRERVEIILRHITKKPVRHEIARLYKSFAFQCFTGGKEQKMLF